MDKKQILNILNKYEACSAHNNQLPLIWKKAKDEYIWDINNRKYIDFTSGIFVANGGHNATTNAILQQLSHSLIYSYNYPTEIKARLLRELIKTTPEFCEKAFLLSTGAEAVECAVKIMKIYGMKTNKTWKRMIYSMKDSMHGKTMLTETLKDNDKDNWTDYNDFIINIPFPGPNDMFLRFFHDVSEVAGIIIESYQGWSGKFYPRPFIKEMVSYCKENKILVCFDEIQGGFWRTGKMFAYEHYDVEPDLICIGKGFGGGMPISAVVGKKELLDLPDDLSSTYSGHPICCASALYNLELLEKMDKKELKEKSEIFELCLVALKIPFKFIKEINIKGLLAGIVLENKEMADKICKSAMKEGLLLVYTGRESIKLGPPLIISKKALMKGLKILKSCLKKLKQ